MVTYTQKSYQNKTQVLLFRSLWMRITIKLYAKQFLTIEVRFFVLLTKLESTAFSD